MSRRKEWTLAVLLWAADAALSFWAFRADTFYGDSPFSLTMHRAVGWFGWGIVEAVAFAFFLCGVMPWLGMPLAHALVERLNRQISLRRMGRRLHRHATDPDASSRDD